SGLIDETEFLQWVARIQALKDDSNTSSSSSSSNNPAQAADDDLTQDLVAAFRVFDRDGNGYITRDELKSAMDMIGENVTEYQLNEMLELADADKDGRINYEVCPIAAVKRVLRTKVSTNPDPSSSKPPAAGNPMLCGTAPASTSLQHSPVVN
uniref:EF-hand domain-containing protein n=1 Tax=Anopheles quadriannulatus TaxID=34691 RepID=A0A182XD04_ANOQN